MSLNKMVLCCFLCLVAAHAAWSQGEPFRVAFWNTENFYDPFVDSTLAYNDFTEDGVQQWNKTRFYRKRNNLYKAILALSENRPLGLLGLCEVENEYVLEALFRWTPLKKHNYRIVHYDGPDARGIDPALVYSLEHFMLVESATIPFYHPQDTAYRTRHILYAKLIAKEDGPSTDSTTVSDTLHVFVNHWPSRYSGTLETAGLRAQAAAILRAQVDSILSAAPEGYLPKVIIMGDMNDGPDEPSVHDVLRARPRAEQEAGDLVNLFARPDELGFDGTLKYRADWQTFDQIIVTEGLLQSGEGLHYQDASARIFHPDFLLVDDLVYPGKKLFRTYQGPSYIGGFSDHLPVYIDLIRN